MDAPQKLEFPCDYPIKVMVRVEPGVRPGVTAVIERHAGPVLLTMITIFGSSPKPSQAIRSGATATIGTA